MEKTIVTSITHITENKKGIKDYIYLKDLAPYLQKTHVKLNLEFLKKLLENASKSTNPHKNQNFASKIRCPINKKKKVSTTIVGWSNGYRTVPFSKLTEIIGLSDYTRACIEENLISIKAGIRRGEILPKFPIKVDEKLGSIVGHILGDGSICKPFNVIFYSNSNVDLLREFRMYMKDIFNVEPRIYIQEKRKFEEKAKWLMRIKTLDEIPRGYNTGLFYPKICGMILHIIFGKFADGKDKKITKCIINANKYFKKGLIRAFFNDEGSIWADSHTMRFYQDNRGLLENIRRLIKDIGVNSHEIRSYLKRNKLRYSFNICGFREYYTFYHSIGCTSLHKRIKFESLINKVKNSKRFKKKFALQPTYD